ncbi:hypothetical protein [Polyangium sp. y55x31]|nr:hypothetical protein [Polyangium sp. y55x31]MDI1478426.1 hypothetical protein [Polyangium sp. y55x31]
MRFSYILTRHELVLFVKLGLLVSCVVGLRSLLRILVEEGDDDTPDE